MVTITSEKNKINIDYEFFTALIIFFIFVIYTITQILNLTVLTGFNWREVFIFVFCFFPGIIGIVILRRRGYSFEECYISFKPLSKIGFLVLSSSIIISLSFMLPSGSWSGWNWLEALVYAPGSGITQELFFRCVLLPVCFKFTKGKKHLAILLHTVLFGIWHIGVFWLAPWWISILVVLVPSIAGYLWALQVNRDKTVIYAIITHCLILIISSMFIW